MDYIQNLTNQAAAAAKVLAVLTESKKNAVLSDMANALRHHTQDILQCNKTEVLQAEENKLDAAMLDRLTLTQETIEDMASGIETIIQLDDPVGKILNKQTRPNGMEVAKMTIPLGVICMIYEARPNVTADASALCFKSGNAVILRCGKEAMQTSLKIAEILQGVLVLHELPTAIISVVAKPAREYMQQLLQCSDTIDLVIPRGGEGLINFVSQNSKIPVIQHFKGVCHLYVDKDADLEKALNILINGKTHRYGVCNALECLVVHEDIAATFLQLTQAALTNLGVTLHACSESMKHLSQAVLLGDDDFGQEYLGPELAIKTVSSFSDAIAHIDRFGSQHTEVICTENTQTAQQFQLIIDASVVMINTSSRFSDGSQLGLGAEIGIATTKLHAYGPMGLESLTAQKYIVTGTGQIRQ